MTERPILFSAPMVLALLAGTKTQTRRIVKGRGSRGMPGFHGGRDQQNDPSAWGWFFDGPDHHGYEVLARGLDERFDNGSVSTPCPYGQPGDRLWVKETWRPQASRREVAWNITYAADGVTLVASLAMISEKWRRPKAAATGNVSPLLMPRWASRITLEVTGVRVERLQEISEADSAAEGWTRRPEVSPDPEVHRDAARDWYSDLWESINGLGSWAANPWVWVVEFKRVTP